MPIFNKRREDEMEYQRPGEQASRPVVHPAQPSTTAAAAAAQASRAMPVNSHSGTTIGRSVTIKGDIRSEEDLLIDGLMEGKLDLGQHRLVVGPNAQVRAAIIAREVEVQGNVNGNVEAAERIILRKNSKLVGDLKMAGVVIEDGAYFKGSIDITRSQAAPPPAPTVVPKPSIVPSAS